MTNSNALVDFERIEKIYEIRYTTKEKPEYEKRRIRKKIKNHWKKYCNKIGVDEKAWHRISETERLRFICHELEEVLKKEHSSEDTLNTIDKNIKNCLSDTLLESQEITKRSNKAVVDIYERYCEADDFEQTKKAAYRKLVDAMTAYDKTIPIPDYEIFSKNPLRAYDYIRDYKAYHIDNTSVVNRIILHFLEESLGLKVNYILIDECLSFLEDASEKGFDVSEYDTYPTDYNEYRENMKDVEDEENVPMSKEEFEESLKIYAKYQEYKKMYQDIKSFYEVDYAKLERFLLKAKIQGSNNKK